MLVRVLKKISTSPNVQTYHFWQLLQNMAAQLANDLCCTRQKVLMSKRELRISVYVNDWTAQKKERSLLVPIYYTDFVTEQKRLVLAICTAAIHYKF